MLSKHFVVYQILINQKGNIFYRWRYKHTRQSLTFNPPSHQPTYIPPHIISYFFVNRLPPELRPGSGLKTQWCATLAWHSPTNLLKSGHCLGLIWITLTVVFQIRLLELLLEIFNLTNNYLRRLLALNILPQSGLKIYICHSTDSLIFQSTASRYQFQ